MTPDLVQSKKITLITTTYNCIGEMEKYFEACAELDRTKFNWIVVDAASTDGTKEFLTAQADRFSYFISEADSGFYFGLNSALKHVTTPYYMVFGADDRPSPTLLEDVLPLLQHNHSLILGGVRLMPSGQIKYPGPRWLHPFVWGRAISHHSVGTIIKTDLHLLHGRYDTSYALVADGLFLKKILGSPDSILRTRLIFGNFMLGGMSSKQELRSIVESFLLQESEGSNPILQLMLFNFRIAKRYIKMLCKYFSKKFYSRSNFVQS